VTNVKLRRSGDYCCVCVYCHVCMVGLVLLLPGEEGGAMITKALLEKERTNFHKQVKELIIKAEKSDNA